MSSNLSLHVYTPTHTQRVRLSQLAQRLSQAGLAGPVQLFTAPPLDSSVPAMLALAAAPPYVFFDPRAFAHSLPEVLLTGASPRVASTLPVLRALSWFVN